MNQKRAASVRYVAKVGILSAIAAVLMLIEIPLFFAPSFYKLDLSDTVALIGGFALGPGAAALIELLKNLLHLVLKGTSTVFVGEAANFVTGCLFVVPAAMLYARSKSKKTALRGSVIGALCLTAAGALVNYFILIPVYVSVLHLPLDAIIAAGTEVNGAIVDLKTLIAFAVVPFNLLKGAADTVLTLLLYKRLSPLLHR